MPEQTTSMYLVLIETSGNQSFIFSTNKLRENVGASEATYRACSQWVLEAVAKITGKNLWNTDSELLRKNLLNAQLNPAIEANEHHAVEVIVAASGKALLLTRTLEQAQQIIEQVTLTALKQAPGLEVCGAIEAFVWNGEHQLSEASRQLHQKFEVVRSLRPSPATRFLRLPIVEDCRTSGLPAARIEADPDRKPIAKSATSLSKRKWSRNALDERLPKLLKNTLFDFAQSLDKILDEDSESNWLAIIHADGNGLGQIFMNLEEYISGDRQDNRNYIKQFRAFSLALEDCTRQAFIEASKVFQPNSKQALCILPLVLGGDDLTVICDAKYALDFTRIFLQTFEAVSKTSKEICPIAENAFGVRQCGLSACAGVAIVKSHFPFSTAYQLAEELTQSAKVVKDLVKKNGHPVPCSAIDFHVLYDTHGTRLEAIRDKLTFQVEGTHLYNRPYVVSEIDQLMQQIGTEKPLESWLTEHHWDGLEKRVKALLKKDKDGRRVLPNSQMHTLREALFMGKEGADGQYALIRKRYQNDQKKIHDIAANHSPSSLFWQDPITQQFVTGFLDAMDAAAFWPNIASEHSNSHQ
jgi:hypothetical protein